MFFFFFFNDTATTEIYTLSLHDALPIWPAHVDRLRDGAVGHSLARQQDDAGPLGHLLGGGAGAHEVGERSEEHTSELQSQSISYAVFCLKKKNKSYDAKKRTHK